MPGAVSMGSGLLEIGATHTVRAALDAVGRTEDVAVSADRSRLALAAFTKNQIYVFSLRIDRRDDAVVVELPGYVVLSCDRLAEPHGCAFLDDEHLLVCNRGGDVILVRVPQPEAEGREVGVDPEVAISGAGFLTAIVKTPGSAAAYRIGDRRYRVFVCSDQWHFVTSHVITLGRHAEVAHEGIRIENTLQIPDGISISPDHQWIAISNHVQGQVQVFRNTPALNQRTLPDAVLHGSICPHGLSFDSHGNLYVADASSPYVHRYTRPHGDWIDQLAPERSFRMLSNRDFYRGRYAAREGGVKGIHVDGATGLLLTTHKLGALEFHDIRSLELTVAKVDADQTAALRQARDAEIVRTKTEVLRRRWTLGFRMRQEVHPLVETARNYSRLVIPYLNRNRLRQQNRRRTESMLDTAGPVVSMTSHSARIASAFLAIESIAEGLLKPSRCVLWLPEQEARRVLPDELVRLRARGLEVCYTADLGPHTKYFPYIASQSDFTVPLVTADDDLTYSRDWLLALARAAQRDPGTIWCHRARRIGLNSYHFEPYVNWVHAGDTEPDPLNFSIGSAGVVYPPSFQRALKAQGTEFAIRCPTADDIWLNWVALQKGFLVAQIAPVGPTYSQIPASQVVNNLYRTNVEGGGNQLQLDATYTEEDRAKLRRLAALGTKTAPPPEPMPTRKPVEPNRE